MVPVTSVGREPIPSLPPASTMPTVTGGRAHEAKLTAAPACQEQAMEDDTAVDQEELLEELATTGQGGVKRETPLLTKRRAQRGRPPRRFHRRPPSLWRRWKKLTLKRCPCPWSSQVHRRQREQQEAHLWEEGPLGPLPGPTKLSPFLL